MPLGLSGHSIDRPSVGVIPGARQVSPGRIPTFVDGEVEVGPRDECLQRFRGLSADMLERRLADREELIRDTQEMFDQPR